MSRASVSRDIGSYLSPKHGDINVTGTAGGAGDNTEASGDWVQVPDDANGAAMLIIWTATLDADETLTLSANGQHASDSSGTGAADFKATTALGADGAGKQTLSSKVVATGPSGGGTVKGTSVIRFPDIRSHAGYFRSQATGDLSRANTDTFEYTVVWIFGGFTSVPPSGHTFLNP